MATQLCLANDTLISVDDSELPEAGDGFWYLVRPVDTCGAGSYDSEGSTQAYRRDETIHASERDCP